MLWPFLISAHVVIAAITAWHILLYKNNIRASIGWIGVVLLSPFLGALLYFLFGINRVARRAYRAKQSKLFSDASTIQEGKFKVPNGLPASIANIGNRLTDYPIVGGNSIQVLEHGDEAYPRMLAAIESAEKTIALSVYIFRLDSAGQRFADALGAAKARGVNVRVLVDGIGSGYFFSPALNVLKEKGIKAQRFMHGWTPWHLPLINLRNHKKLLIIDGTIGFVGGLNLSSQNVLNIRKEREVNDTQFCLKGPAVAQLMASFAEDWHFTSGEALSSDAWWPEQTQAGSAPARAINSGPDEDIGKIETILAVAINSARHHIRIVTPYFLPEAKLKFLINLAVLRGVKIDLVVPAITDSRLVDCAMRGVLSHMDTANINCVFSTGPFDHSKLVTVDGVWCAFGSSNWDARSLRLNFEIMVECYDKKTISRINGIIDEKMKLAQRLEPQALEARSQYTKIKHAAARLLVPYL